MHCILVFNVVVGLFGLCYVMATGDQLIRDFAGVLSECLTEHPLTVAELESLKNKKIADSIAAKCLYACAFRKTGLMDTEGNVSAEGLTELSKKYFANDAEKFQASEDLNKLCLNVNKVAVGDGNKGCDRAALLFQCSITNATAFYDTTS